MDETYKAVAAQYERTYGEYLVADWDWVEPLYLAVEAAVVSERELDFDGQIAETIRRTADVIATITHGVDGRLEAVLREIRDMAAHPGFVSRSGEPRDACDEIHKVADEALRHREEARA